MTARTTRPDVYERSKQRKNPPEKRMAGLRNPQLGATRLPHFSFLSGL